MRIQSTDLKRCIEHTALLTLIASFATGVALAQGSQQTEESVYWFFDTENPVGTSRVIRTPSGATAIFQTSGLPAGQAVTLWFIIFNNPENCVANPCQPSDLGDLATGGDFHFGAGNVTGGRGNATFAGHLQVGDVSGSGWAEFGAPPVPLDDPYAAEIMLAIHSHGPKMTGQDLKYQLNSFLGGCAVFLGPGGFAASPDDVPDAPGECSTIQFSHHLP